MNFAKIKDDYLDYPFLEDPDGLRTLREELENIGEDLISASYEIEEENNGTKVLNKFIAWSDDSVIFLNYGLFNEKFLSKLPRNPISTGQYA